MKKPTKSGKIFPRRLNYNLKMKLSLIFFVTISFVMQANSSYSEKAKISMDKESMIVPKPQFQVSGKVTDTEGLPLSGANILEKGTTNGVTADFDGNFTIKVADDNSILLISYIGFATKEVAVNGQTNLVIILAESTSGLDEVIVVGYGTQKRSDITGSVAVVDVEALKTIPATTVEGMLQGQAAGLTVISSGTPGGPSNMFIRGMTSFGDNQPLFIIDGVQGEIINLNPDDIASIQVLKDAGAAAIYGVRGANGVIVITTKKGIAGSPEVSYSGTFGWTFPPSGNILNLASPAETAAFIYKVNPLTQLFPGGVVPDYSYAGPGGVRGVANEGDPAVDPSKYVFDAKDPSKDYLIQKLNKEDPLGTDWFHQVFKPAFTQNQNFSVRGGTDNANYLISLGYLNQKGNHINSYLKRYSARINTNFKIGNNFRVGQNTYIFQKQTNPLGLGETLSDPYLGMPIIPVHDIMGNYGGTWLGPELGSFFLNPVARMENTDGNIGNNWQIFGNIYAELDFLKHFTVRSSFGGTIDNRYSLIFYPNRYYDLEFHNGANRLEESSGYTTNWIWTNTVTYNQVFGKHNVKLLAGTEAISDYGRNLGGSASGLFSTDPSSLLLSNGSFGPTNFSNASIDNLYSLFGRIDYSFDDKYLLAGTLRRDGSSRFGTNSKYGVFPSVSLGWKISKESFMSEIKWIDDLKLRGSWGKLGSQNNVPTTNAYSLYSSNFANSYYDISGSGSIQQGFYQSAIGNPSTGWEENIIENIGIDATIFNNMFNVSVELYKKSTNGLLFPKPLAGTAGDATPPTINIGDIQNTGLDLSLNYHGGRNSDFKYTISPNVTIYKNLIVSIPDPGYFDLGLVRNQEGHPISSFFGYKTIGFFENNADVDNSPTQQDAAPGRFKYEDVDGDGVITPDDRTFFGDPNPDFTYGVNLSATYKNFDFSMILYGSQGNDVFNTWQSRLTHLGLPQAYSKDLIYDSWTPDNLNPKAPIVEGYVSNFSTSGTSFYVEDGSFLKCRSLLVGYSLPSTILEGFKISKFRLYAQVTNMFMITKYSGLDPELMGTSQSFGIDGGNYPNNFQGFNLGIDVTF